VFEQAADAAEDMGRAVDDAGTKSAAGLTRVGEGADNAETRIMGLKDGVDGMATIMKGPGEQGIAAYLQGWADFASGVANFAVPAFQKLYAMGAQQIATTMRAAAATAASVATQVGQWIVLGAQATAQAARVAAAWLISMGPIAAVGIAVAGLAYVFIRNWDTIKDAVVRGAQFIVDKMLGAAEWIVRAGAAAFGWVPGLGGKLKAAAKAVEDFRDEVNVYLDGIRRDIVIRLSAEATDVMQRNFGVPTGAPVRRFHDGGWVPGRPGQEVPGILQAGEYVVPAGRAAPPLPSVGQLVVHTRDDPLRIQGAVTQGLRNAAWLLGA